MGSRFVDRLSIMMLCFVFVAMFLGAFPLQAAERWLSVRSKNFLLVGNASESSIKRIGRELEEFRAAISRVSRALNQQSAIGTTVIVFRDDSSFRPYKPLYNGKPANLAGYFQAGEDANFIALSADIQSPHVVYHEFVHSLTKDSSLPLPAWVNEGLAEVYSMFELIGREITLGRAIGDHIALLNRQAMLPLDVLLSVDRGSPYYNERTKQGMFYAESWALVHFLLFGDNQRRQRQFTTYLDLADNGKSVEANFREAFQTDFKTLEEELRRYVQGQVAWPAIRAKLSDNLDFDREMQVSALPEAEAQYYLGDLLLHTNRLDAAETQLEKAITLDPKFASSYASLGLLRVRQGNKEEAFKLLKQAVEGDSRNHLAHFYYAQTLQQFDEDGPAGERKSRLDTMRTHILKTIELAPRFAPAYTMLGYIALVSREGVADAEKALKQGVAYAPGRLELRLALAQLMLVNGETAQAEPLLVTLKNSASNEIVRGQAELLLDDIKNRRKFDKDLQAYRQSLSTAEPQEVETPTITGPPRLTRNSRPTATTSADKAIDTAKPADLQLSVPRIEGALTYVDCSTGLTLRLRAGGSTVELHTDNPDQVEFVSYVTAVKDTIPCGALEPEVPVAILYKHSDDQRFLGEPLHVEFVNPAAKN